MKFRTLASDYTRGWACIFQTLLLVLVWEVVVLLPIFPFVLLFPDQLEGKAEGSVYFQLACLLCIVVWAPFAAAGLGPLGFTKSVKKDTRMDELTNAEENDT